MLKTLKDWFDTVLPPPGTSAAPADEAHALQLATAVLLVEVMRADPTLHDAERDAVLAALRSHFALTDDEAAGLVELAHQASKDATDFYAFTERINERFAMAQKILMVEQMWRVAYADGTLAAHEQHVLWRLADLLHVPHGAYVNAKMRARDGGGGATPAETPA